MSIRRLSGRPSADAAGRPVEDLVAAAWAKSADSGADWLPLPRHLADAASVAGLLFEGWLSPAARVLIADACGGGDSGRRLARGVVVFVAAGHDIGKFGSPFNQQVPSLADRLRAGGMPYPVATVDTNRKAPHATVGHISLTAWVAARFPHAHRRQRRALSSLGMIVASHHGVTPTQVEIDRARDILTAEAGSDWERGREHLWDRALTASGLTDDDLLTVAAKPLPVPVQVVLTGLLIVADWIASNTDFFPFADVRTSPERAEDALRALNLPQPWRPTVPGNVALLFARRFDLPEGASPRPSQRATVEAAEYADGPCLILVEAPTGEGKTEAALAAAETLAHRFGRTGVTVALPTCATADAMFVRTLSWLRRTDADSDMVGVALTHGRAQFSDDYRELFRNRGIRHVYDDGEGGSGTAVRAHWWLTRKKAALTDFTVGTIDQVLFGALRSRHLMLRHLGFVGKVVILDEVHASDAYMRVYLYRIIEWLAALGVPIVALSATLPPAVRAGLLAAYRRGRRATLGTPYDDGMPAPDEIAALGDITAYPLISVVTADDARSLEPARSARTRRFAVTELGDDQGDLVESVCADVADGGCVAVVRNTVRRAQETYEALVDRLGAESVLLLHSRFIAIDRSNREREIVRELGPRGADRRPHRRVVVATQVIEQSLDVDFDRMYSDLAPIDLLIQRAGRLHRHESVRELRPAGLREARLILTGFDREDAGPPRFDPGSRAVYGAAPLLRAVAVLDRHRIDARVVVRSPEDVAPLVRAAFEPALAAPPGWEDAWVDADAAWREHEATQEREARVFRLGVVDPGGGLTGWNAANLGEADDSPAGQAQVRDIEEGVEVVVVQEVDGAVRALPWLANRGGEQVDLSAGIDDELAREVARCTVTLPPSSMVGGRVDQVIDQLERRGFDSWQSSRWLRGTLPLILDESLRAEVADLVITYDVTLGLIVTRKEKQ